MIKNVDHPETNEFKIPTENEATKENAYSSKIMSKLQICLKDLQSAIKSILKENLEALSLIQKKCERIMKDIESLEKSLRQWISASKLTELDDTYLNAVENFKNSIHWGAFLFNENFSSFQDSCYFNYDNQIYEDLNSAFGLSIKAPYSPSLRKKEDIQIKDEKKEPEEPNKERQPKRRHQKTPKSEINEYDILIVMRYTKVSKLQAIDALKATKGNFTNAILYLTTGKIPSDD